MEEIKKIKLNVHFIYYLYIIYCIKQFLQWNNNVFLILSSLHKQINTSIKNGIQKLMTILNVILEHKFGIEMTCNLIPLTII